MAEKLNNFEKFDRKKNQISALFSTQRPPDDWPDALDHIAIGLVANKYTKLGKTSETLLLSQGLSYMKIPLHCGIDEDDHHLCRCQEMITNERICVSMC